MAQGRMYSLIMDAATITAAKDLISFTVPADVACILHEVNVSQESVEVSDTGAIQIHFASGVAGVGTAATPRALDDGNTIAAGGTALVNLTTDETEGNILMRRGWNVLTPFKWLPTPPAQIVVTGAGIICVRSDVAITSAVVTAEMIIELLG